MAERVDQDALRLKLRAGLQVDAVVPDVLLVPDRPLTPSVGAHADLVVDRPTPSAGQGRISRLQVFRELYRNRVEKLVTAHRVPPARHRNDAKFGADIGVAVVLQLRLRSNY